MIFLNNDPALIFPFLVFIPMLVLLILKTVMYSAAQTIFLGNFQNVIITLFLQATQFCFIASIHFWLRSLHQKMKWPTFYINSIFLIIYLEILGFSINDLDYLHRNMQMIIPSTYVQYFSRHGLGKVAFLPFWSNITGQTKVFRHGFGKFIVLGLIILAILLKLISMSWSIIIDSATPQFLLKNKNRQKKKQPQNNKDNRIIYLIVNLLGLFDFIFFTYVILKECDYKAKYYSILPHSSALFLASTHFESKPSPKTLSKITNITRNYLPPRRYWIDTREKPIYPEVHCDFDTFCSYNKQSKICQKNRSDSITKEEIIKEDEMPNIAVLMVESFNPATYLINDEFLRDHVQNPKSLKTNIPFYNKTNLPFLHEFAKNEGITFSGMQTLGLPSHSGLHSLLSNQPPMQSYMNLVNGWQNHVDDFPSYFHQKGYRTLIFNANRFSFDGKQFWIYKKSKYEEAQYRLNCLSSYGDSFNDSLQRQIGDYSMVKDMKETCSEKEINDYINTHDDIYDFPRFFDYASAYYPTREQAEKIGIDPQTVYDHPSHLLSPDRIVSKQIEAHWKQHREIMKNKGKQQPIMILASSVEGHRPYGCNDMPQFYEENNIKNKRVSKFIKVNKYTDQHYLKEIISWLKENEPNTIVLITGDHGTRDVPIKEKNGKVVDGVKFDPKCVQESTGSDSFFLVSGVMSYLGHDERIRKAFGLDKLAGKTIKFTVDHGDMIYTTIDIIQRLRGQEMKPTNRKSRNIIDMSLELLNENDEDYSKKIDKSGWKSVSAVSHNIEYHHGMKMVRFHPADPMGAHIYENCVYPTGLLSENFNEKRDKRTFSIPREEKNEEKKKKLIEFVNEAIEFISAENYLGIKNQLFNYDFRNDECIKNRNCSLPEKLPDLTFNDYQFLYFVLIIFLLAEVLFNVPVLIGVFYNYYKMDSNNDFENLLTSKADEKVEEQIEIDIEKDSKDETEEVNEMTNL